MELKIISEKQSTLPRRDVEATITYEDATTPSRKQLQELIAKKSHGKENLVVIKSIKPIYGQREARFSAFIYEHEDSMKKIEQAKMILKNQGKKQEKPEEKKTEG